MFPNRCDFDWKQFLVLGIILEAVGQTQSTDLLNGHNSLDSSLSTGSFSQYNIKVYMKVYLLMPLESLRNFYPESPYNLNERINFESTVTSTQRQDSQLNSTMAPEFNLTSTTTFQKQKLSSYTESMDFVEPEVKTWATPEVIQRVGKEFGKENSLNVLLNSTKLDYQLI